VLETARWAGLSAPFSCEAGNCATCMAFVQEGAVTMRANNALTPDEVEEGWVLTCQALPTSSSLTIEYEPL
jgi:ferredoxin